MSYKEEKNDVNPNYINLDVDVSKLIRFGFV